jgi:hypothetical protein
LRRFGLRIGVAIISAANILMCCWPTSFDISRE